MKTRDGDYNTAQSSYYSVELQGEVDHWLWTRNLSTPSQMAEETRKLRTFKNAAFG